MREGGRTDKELTVAFRNFSKATKIGGMTMVLENVSTRGKACLSVTLCTINPTLQFEIGTGLCLPPSSLVLQATVASSAFGTAVLKDRLIHRSRRQMITMCWKCTAICILCNYKTTSLNNGQSQVF